MSATLTRNEEATPDQMGDLIPVFVYGTLRVGHGNHSWAIEAVRHYVTDVTAEGAIYFVGPYGGYPVAKFDEPGTILGDILWMDAGHPTYREVVRMEIGAGYELRTVAVSTDEGEVKCQAFHYIRRPGGPQIPSGDWSTAEL